MTRDDTGRDGTRRDDTGSGRWASIAVAPSPADQQVEQMVADPATYFIRARQEAKREARRYVARRLREARPA